jgi:hypothetical protein
LQYQFDLLRYPLLLPHLLNVKPPSNAIPTTATAHAFEFSQVTSSAGEAWIDKNLGASQVARQTQANPMSSSVKPTLMP